MPIWLKWLVAIIASFFAYGFSKGAYDLVRLPKFLRTLCRDAFALQKLSAESGYKPDNSLGKVFGYQKLLEIDVQSSIRAWKKGKWLPIGLYFVMLIIVSLLGPRYQIPAYVALFSSFLGDASSNAKQDVLILVNRLQSVINEWYAVEPVQCEKYCTGEGAEYFGNMYLLASRKS